MSGLRARIIRLERHVPIGLEAELQALSDNKKLEQRLEAIRREMSEEDIRAMAREHPEFYTEPLEAKLARWRRLCQNIEDKNPAPTGSARAR